MGKIGKILDVGAKSQTLLTTRQAGFLILPLTLLGGVPVLFISGLMIAFGGQSKKRKGKK